MSGTYAHFNKLIARYRLRLDLDLGKLTAIGGPNQTYKTTLGLNYRLPLTGKLPNAETHLGAALSAGGAIDPSVGFTNELHSVDGIATFRCPPKGNTQLLPLTGKLAALEPFRNELIISDVADKIFSPKSDIGREAFIRAFGSKVALDAPGEMTPALQDIWERAIKALPANEQEKPTAMCLASLTEWLRLELSSASNKVEKAKAKLDGARELSKATQANKASATEVDALRKLLDAAQRWEAYQQLQTAETVLLRADASRKLSMTSDIRNWLVTAFQPKSGIKTAKATKACPLCRTGLSEDHAAKILAAFNAQVEKHEKAAAGLTAYAVGQAQAQKTKALAVLGGVTFEVPAEPSAENKSVEALRAKLAGITRVGQNSTQPLTSLSNALQDAEAYYTDVQTLKALVTSLSVRTLEKLVRDATDYMAARMDGVEPYLTVGVKNIEWGVVGRHRKVAPFKDLSGRERGLLMSAGAQALARTEFRVVVIDDDQLGVFDADNIVAYARVLANAVERGELTQVLFTWNRVHELLPLAKEDWTIINTGGQ